MEPLAIFRIDLGNFETLQDFIELDKMTGFHHCFQAIENTNISQKCLIFLIDNDYKLLIEEGFIRFYHNDYMPINFSKNRKGS